MLSKTQFATITAMLQESHDALMSEIIDLKRKVERQGVGKYMCVEEYAKQEGITEKAVYKRLMRLGVGVYNKKFNRAEFLQKVEERQGKARGDKR